MKPLPPLPSSRLALTGLLVLEVASLIGVPLMIAAWLFRALGG